MKGSLLTFCHNSDRAGTKTQSFSSSDVASTTLAWKKILKIEFKLPCHSEISFRHYDSDPSRLLKYFARELWALKRSPLFCMRAQVESMCFLALN